MPNVLFHEHLFCTFLILSYICISSLPLYIGIFDQSIRVIFEFMYLLICILPVDAIIVISFNYLVCFTLNNSFSIFAFSIIFHKTNNTNVRYYYTCIRPFKNILFSVKYEHYMFCRVCRQTIIIVYCVFKRNFC